MIREDLVDGAVTFLQDSSVASAPVEQKIAFLRSKNLTQEEIDASLSRAGIQAQPQSPSSHPPPYRTTPPPLQQQQQQYNSYPPQQYWNPQYPPPPPPGRDWRDYFITATLIGGLGYTLYWTAQRYLFPLISPPTPPQLEQDKAAIDESFSKAFALLDQLATDTQELKSAEQARKERLDNALSEVEAVVAKIREANQERENEAKRLAREMQDIREQIPMSIQHEKHLTDERLSEIVGEMRSLKLIVQNRVAPQQQKNHAGLENGANSGANANATATASPAPENVVGGSGSALNGSLSDSEAQGTKTSHAPSAPSAPRARPWQNRLLGNSVDKPQIPTWQLAAKKTEEANQEAPAAATSESGTVADADTA